VTGPVVLVVDDSPTIRKIVEITLKRQGVQVISAPSGVIALAAIANTPPQLVLLDIMLPKVNGYQICQIIRRNPEYKHIPVVMLSGKDGVFDKVRGKLVGATEYITKPFEPRDLMRVVRKYVKLDPEPGENAGVRKGVATIGASRVS
jgi:twitching motility two-component system response regulator PilG